MNYRLMIFSLILFSGCNYPGNSNEAGDSVRIVGLDRDRTEITRSFKETVMMRMMNRIFSKTQNSTLNALETVPHGTWSLTRVTVGLLLELEFQLAEIMELGAEAAIELRYERLPAETN